MTPQAPLPGIQTAERVIKADAVLSPDHVVTLDVSDGLDWEGIAKRVHADPHLRWCWSVLARNTSSESHRQLALRDLRAEFADQPDIALRPDDAEDLAHDLIMLSLTGGKG